MLAKLLVANRGEIALRIIRACKEIGIRSVAIFSEEDADSLPTRLADEAVCVGPADNHKSYLNQVAVLSAARITGADAIHPGYGFLAENSHFVKLCTENGFTFVGPDATTITRMGDKATARSIMDQEGIPVIPGSRGPVSHLKKAMDLAERIGYPLLIKSSAGGGGRGIRVVYHNNQLANAFQLSQVEARACFGCEEVYLEKYIEGARHIEVQILGDHYGNIVHLGERDCSIQRRHQKLIEEAPSPVVTHELRHRLGETAVRAAHAVNYRNAGTVEFLVAPDHSFHFIEMNTRIQVEHPITEMVTGVNLIKQQLLIAAGDHLDLRQEEIHFRGHAMECRICAEDPVTFQPSVGRITNFVMPGGLGVRVDSAIYLGYNVSAYYDSLLAKLVSHGEDRQEALARLQRCLDEFVIEGVRTNIAFYRHLVRKPEFRRGQYTTEFLQFLDN